METKILNIIMDLVKPAELLHISNEKGNNAYSFENNELVIIADFNKKYGNVTVMVSGITKNINKSRTWLICDANEDELKSLIKGEQ